MVMTSMMIFYVIPSSHTRQNLNCEESVFYQMNIINISGSMYINCEFVDSDGNRTFQTMTLLNIDWSFQDESEYNLEPHGFIMRALQNDYSCLQNVHIFYIFIFYVIIQLFNLNVKCICPSLINKP